MKNKRNRQGNVICGECIRDISECPWLSKGQDIDGWKAKKVKYVHGDGVKSETRSISKCPLFIKHPKSALFDEKGGAGP